MPLRPALRPLWLCLLLLAAFSAVRCRAQQTLPERIDQLATAYAREGRLNGMVTVAQDGKILFERGYGYADYAARTPITPETRFFIGSVTKQFTAAVILQLVGEGKLRLDAPLSELLPEPAYPAAARVTLHQLLTHTSGIPSYTDRPDFPEFVGRDHTLREILEGIAREDLAFAPGSRWAYNNSGYLLAAAIAERAGGKDLAALMQERLFGPAGMTTAALYGGSTAGAGAGIAAGHLLAGAFAAPAPAWVMSNAHGAGAILARPRDLVAWDAALRDGRILPPDLRRLMETPHVPVGGADFYGYGVFVDTVRTAAGPRVRISHGGGLSGFLTAFDRYPAEGYVVVVTDNGNLAPAPLARSIGALLLGETPPMPTRTALMPVSQALAAGGAEAAIARFRALHERPPEGMIVGHDDLNQLGYALLRQQRTADAVALFRANVEAFPGEANPYDSLGEALLAARDTAGAAENYLKAYAMNPANQNARAVLERIGALPPSTDAVLSPAQLDAVTGSYALAPGFVLRIWREGDGLKLQATGQPAVDLYPRSPTEFYLKIVPASITFEQTDGRTTGLVLHQNGMNLPGPRQP